MTSTINDVPAPTQVSGVGQQHNWKTLKLDSREIEQLFRWHVQTDAKTWLELHLSKFYGYFCSAPHVPSLVFADQRRSYLMSLAELDWKKIRNEVYRDVIGDMVKKCDCNSCLGLRNRLFPERAEDWEKKRQEQQWMEFADEVQRQFPGLSSDELGLMIQRTIQSNRPSTPVTQAARQAVEIHAQWQTDFVSLCRDDGVRTDEAMVLSKPKIDELLAKWGGSCGKEGHMGMDSIPQTTN